MATLTRRQLLETLGVAPLLAAAQLSSPRTYADVALQPFSLTDVRLLAGPFLQAQKRDEDYLLKLEPDRMLHNFRVNAGIEPKAKFYGGW